MEIIRQTRNRLSA